MQHNSSHTTALSEAMAAIVRDSNESIRRLGKAFGKKTQFRYPEYKLEDAANLYLKLKPYLKVQDFSPKKLKLVWEPNNTELYTPTFAEFLQAYNFNNTIFV